MHLVDRRLSQHVAHVGDQPVGFGRDIQAKVLFEGELNVTHTRMIECTVNSHILSSIGEVLVVVFALFWATGLVVDTQSRQSLLVDSYCLNDLLTFR